MCFLFQQLIIPVFNIELRKHYSISFCFKNLKKYLLFIVSIREHKKKAKNWILVDATILSFNIIDVTGLFLYSQKISANLWLYEVEFFRQMMLFSQEKIVLIYNFFKVLYVHFWVKVLLKREMNYIKSFSPICYFWSSIPPRSPQLSNYCLG